MKPLQKISKTYSLQQELENDHKYKTMNLTTFLKNQFINFVEVYRTNLLKTFSVAITYTIFCFVIMALLLRFTEFDLSLNMDQKSILSFFFARYSYGNCYSIIDLSKTVLLFFVAMFSLGLIRNNSNSIDEQEFKNTDFFKVLSFNDILMLSSIFVICVIFDYGCYKLDTWVYNKIALDTQIYYFNSLIFFFRIFLPLVVFSLVTYKLAYGRKIKINFRKIIFLFIAVWLFNEFAYEFTSFFRDYIFPLFLMPFKPQQIFFVESILGLPLIAFFFLGYHSAMTYSLKQQEVEENELV